MVRDINQAQQRDLHRIQPRAQHLLLDKLLPALHIVHAQVRCHQVLRHSEANKPAFDAGPNAQVSIGFIRRRPLEHQSCAGTWKAVLTAASGLVNLLGHAHCALPENAPPRGSSPCMTIWASLDCFLSMLTTSFTLRITLSTFVILFVSTNS